MHRLRQTRNLIKFAVLSSINTTNNSWFRTISCLATKSRTKLMKYFNFTLTYPLLEKEILPPKFEKFLGGHTSAGVFLMGPATVKGLFYISNSYLVDQASSHMLVLNAFIWTSLTKVLCHTCKHEYPLREGDSTFFRFYKKSATIYNWSAEQVKMPREKYIL